jgi:hypothetical protein
MFESTRKNNVALHCNEITGDREWLERFCIRIGKKVKWRTEANIRNATFEDLKLAKEHGLQEVTLGVEALDDELLIKTNKGHSVDDAFLVFSWLQKLNIGYRFSLRTNIGETPVHLNGTIEKLKEMKRLGLSPSGIRIGSIESWPGNSKWKTQEYSDAGKFERTIKKQNDKEEVVKLWKLIGVMVKEVERK